jgi:uncharacterized protein (UPF0276 family)
MDRLGVGVPLFPDYEYLELLREVIEDEADYFEINPETLWRKEERGLARNDFYPLFRQLRDRSRKPFVAHGLGFSLGTPVAEDRERTEAWLARLRDDQAEFRFPWISEHLGWQIGGGLQAVLPLPLPPTDEAVAVVAERMRLLSAVAGTSAFENNANYFELGGSRDPEFFNAICRAAPCRLMLDLHNVHTQCLNLGHDANDYVDRIDLDTVVQIHVSGGSESEAEWLPSRRVFRLDSHDGPIPEEVWRLLERVRPRCRNLRGIVVERLNGTFGAADVPRMRDDVRRAKELLRC